MKRSTDRELLLLTGERWGETGTLGHYCVTRMERWSALTDRLPRIRPSTVLVLEPYWGSEKIPDEFWDALSLFPSLPVVAVLPVSRVSSTELRRMQLAGVCGILNLRFTHSGSLHSQMADAAFAHPLKRRVEMALSRFLGGDARILIRAAAEVAVCGGSAEDLAKVFSVGPSTVTNWCEALHLPPPRRLQLWLRLLLAAQLMEDAGRSIPAAACAAGYATDRSFRRAVRGLLGASPRELRKQGAFDTLLKEFNADLRRYRLGRSRATDSTARVLVPPNSGEKQITSRTEDKEP